MGNRLINIEGSVEILNSIITKLENKVKLEDAIKMTSTESGFDFDHCKKVWLVFKYRFLMAKNKRVAGKRWSDEEHIEFVENMIECSKKKMTFHESIESTSEILDRTTDSCEREWYKVIIDKYSDMLVDVTFRGTHWIPKDDLTLLHCMIYDIETNSVIRKGFNQASVLINRGEKACKSRWINGIKEDPDILKKLLLQRELLDDDTKFIIEKMYHKMKNDPLISTTKALIYALERNEYQNVI